MKYFSIKSNLMAILVVVCTSIVGGGFAEWGQEEYDNFRRDLINTTTQLIQIFEAFQQNYAQEDFLQHGLDALIANVPQQTRNEVSVILKLFGDGRLSAMLREMYKIRELWKKHPYDPNREQELISFLQQYIQLSAQYAIMENKWSEDIQNISTEQIISRTLDYISERQTVRQQIKNLIEQMSIMD